MSKMKNVAPCIYLNKPGTHYTAKFSVLGVTVHKSGFETLAEAISFRDRVSTLNLDGKGEFVYQYEKCQSRKRSAKYTGVPSVYSTKRNGTYYVHAKRNGVLIYKSGFRTMDEAKAFTASLPPPKQRSA